MTTSYQDIANEIGALVEAKNKAYGDSFAQAGDVLRIFFPDGVRPEQYTDMLGIVRVVDKLFRIATAPTAFDESPWRDIAGYGILGCANASDLPISLVPAAPHVPSDMSDTMPSEGQAPAVEIVGETYCVCASHPDKPGLQSAMFKDAIEAYRAFWAFAPAGYRVSIHRPDGSLLDSRVSS